MQNGQGEATWVAAVEVIDTDSHICEPPTLFADRVPSRWRDDPDLPVVRREPETGEDMWYVAGVPDLSVGLVATAGWPRFYPERPRRWEEIVDPASFDAQERLRRMDEYGLRAQILYPNIGGFGSWLRIADPDLRLACVRAYNDFAVEWTTADPQRLVPMMGIPFWDTSAAVAEMERCAALGFRGMFFGSRPDNVGLPRLTDRHWDPVWSTAQELGWSVNFHIGFNNSSFAVEDPTYSDAASIVKLTTLTFLTNAHAIVDVIVSGLCRRFPSLQFVSVESGAGYVPFLLDALDWQWRNCGMRDHHPELDLLPSEYFRRQVYCTFWFETGLGRSVFDRIGDNLMYETDFPHPTSMSPGPRSVADVPRDFITAHYSDVPEALRAKVFHGNAARLYKLS